MNTFDVFKTRLENLRALIKNKDEEYVRFEALGIDVHEMVHHKDAGTLEIHGLDENNVEAVLICPVGHFSGKLTFAPKGKKRPIGFQMAKDNQAEQIEIK